MLNVNTQNSPYCVSPISHSPNSLGLSSHWGLTHHYIPSMCPYPYSHLNHLLTTQHMLHNNLIGTSHGPHGLSNHVMPPGMGTFHHNNVPTNFSGIHGLSTNSLMDSKDGSSGEWFPDLFYTNFYASIFIYEYLLNTLIVTSFLYYFHKRKFIRWRKTPNVRVILFDINSGR